MAETEKVQRSEDTEQRARLGALAMYSGNAELAKEEGGELENMTKAELVELAEDRGIEVPSSATKAEIVAALESEEA